MDTGNLKSKSPDSVAIVGQNAENWYAVHTRAAHERAVAHRLRDRGVTTFLPTFTEVHRWKDRRKTLELPLFSCYLFVKLLPRNEERQERGVVGYNFELHPVGPWVAHLGEDFLFLGGLGHGVDLVNVMGHGLL